jgi:hypothetical protein
VPLVLQNESNGRTAHRRATCREARANDTRHRDVAGRRAEHQPKNFAASLSGRPRSAAQKRAKHCALGGFCPTTVMASAITVVLTQSARFGIGEIRHQWDESDGAGHWRCRLYRHSHMQRRRRRRRCDGVWPPSVRIEVVATPCPLDWRVFSVARGSPERVRSAFHAVRCARRSLKLSSVGGESLSGTRITNLLFAVVGH